MCGKPLLAQMLDSNETGLPEVLEADVNGDLQIIGFCTGNGVLHTSPDEWSVLQGLHEQMTRHLATQVKGEEMIVDSRDVYFTQSSVSPTSGNGMTLVQLTQYLQDGLLDPLETGWLVLDVMQVYARRDRRPGSQRKLVYFTLDHRRLKAMKDASCPEVKVCVYSHHKLSDFVNKGMDRIGLRSDIRVNDRKRASSGRS